MNFLIGIFVGGLLFWLFTKPPRPAGTFVMDLTDPMKDVCTLELDKNLNYIYSKKRIVLTVRVIEENSQK